MATEQDLIREILVEVLKTKPDICKFDHKWLIETISSTFKANNNIQLDCTKEINGLAFCLLWGIVDSIRNNYTRRLNTYEATVILRKLVIDYGQQEELSRWCVNTWCIALNKSIDTDVINKITIPYKSTAFNLLSSETNKRFLSHSEQVLFKYMYEVILNHQINDDIVEQIQEKGRILGLSTETIDNLFDLAEKQITVDLSEVEVNPDYHSVSEEDSSIQTTEINSEAEFKLGYPKTMFEMQTSTNVLGLNLLHTVILLFSGFILIWIIGIFYSKNDPQHPLNEHSKIISTDNTTISRQEILRSKGQKWVKDGGWTTFGHDTRHTNRSPFKSPKDFSVKWKLKHENCRFLTSPVIAADGTIYIVGDDGNLYAVYNTGSIKWRFDTFENNRNTYKPNHCKNYLDSYDLEYGVYSTPAVDTDGTVYFGALESNIFAVDPFGKLIWSNDTVRKIYGSPSIGENGFIYFLATTDNYDMLALDHLGSIQWSKGLWPNMSTPAIGVDGTIYLGAKDNMLCAFNPDGSSKWTFVFGDQSFYSTPAIADDGTIYIGCNDGKLYAINSDSSKKWTYSTAGDINTSPAIAADGTIYIRSKDFYLHAVNSNGTRKWVYHTNLDTKSSPIINGDGIIFTTGINGNLEAVSPTGKKLWKSDISGLMSTPAIASDGTIYAIMGDYSLYAIGESKEN